MNKLMNINMTPHFKNEQKPTTSVFGDIDFSQLLQSKINEAIYLNNNMMNQNRSYNVPLTQMATINDYFASTTQKNLPTSNFNSIIKDAAEKFSVDEKLIHSVIKMESNYRPGATSRSGAQGLMQLMPQTARGLGVKNAYDPKQNIYGGTKYLRQMLNQFDGNTKLALAAYNAGPGNVNKFGGMPPFKETQNYVKNVLNNYFA